MKKLLLLITLVFLHFTTYAQTASINATISFISFEKLEAINIIGTKLPPVGQEVLVHKIMENGFFTGKYELVRGTISSVSKTKITIQPEEYLSTLTEDGVNRPMAKVGQKLLIEWEDEEYINELEILQNAINEADLLIKEGENDKAISILLPLNEKYSECYACSYLLGKAYLDEYDEDEAIDAFTKVVDNVGEKYSKAYFYRAEAYASVYPHQYENAIKDYRKTIEYIDDKEDEVFILRKIVYLYEQLEDSETACKVVNEMEVITGETQEIKESHNQYCNKIEIPEYPKIRIDGSVKSQSEDLNTITIESSNEAQDCFYINKEELAYLSIRRIAVGDYFKMGECSPNFGMSSALVQVKSIKNGLITFEVLYWTARINDLPWRSQYDKDAILTFSW